MAREMKDSGVAWIGEIPSDWQMAPLKRFSSVNSGREIQIEVDADTPGAVGVYGSGGIFKYTMTEQYDGTAVLFGRKGTLGKPLYVQGKFWAVDTMYFLTYRKQLLEKYSYYQLSAFDWGPYITQTAIPSIVASEITACPFPVPSVNEQKKISEFLDQKCAEIDAVLEKIRTSIEEYKKLKQEIITQAVTKGIRGDRPMKGSGIEWLSEVPADWKIYQGKRLFCETNERSETGNEELLTVSHITGITPRSQKNVNMFMSESLVGYKVCHIGDIAANTMWMWQGAIGVSAYHGVISPSYNTYRQRNDDFDSQFLDYLLRIRPLVDMYNACSTGITASRFRLYPEQFLSFKFPVPPMEEQHEIVDFLTDRVGEMDLLIQKKELFLTELETYKNSLIYEYVTGKKEVPDAVHLD